MLNLPLLPASQPVSSHTGTVDTSITPVMPASGQSRERTFSDVLKNTEEVAFAEKQDSITMGGTIPNEPPAAISDNMAHPLLAGIIAHPATPLTPPSGGSMLSTNRNVSDDPSALLTGSASITEQQDFSAASRTNTNIPPSQLVSAHPDSTPSRPVRPVFTGASSLNAEVPLLNTGINMLTPASSVTELLPYIDTAGDNTAIFTANGKFLPPSIAASNVSPATTSVSVSSALGDSAWPDEFSQKITWLATQRLQTAELKLHPAHLGPIEVLLKITNEQGVQQLTAQFASHNPLVREAIEANLPRLREIMAESGISLTDTSVGADSPRQDAQNRQQTHAHPQRTSSEEHISSTNIRRASGQIVTSHTGIISTFA
ncbi:MAG: flagellar hook-length control protein FliK [Nitrosomonas sp.]|nr:flagellar hook-length control protein FliK [Nitrosomonas sp.]